MEEIKKSDKTVPVKVRGVWIGEGAPKICVPFTGDKEDEILRQAEEAVKAGPDLAEWRADGFEGAEDEERTEALARRLRGVLGEIVLIVTYRTKKEGGKGTLMPEEYPDFVCRAAASGCADIVDAELSAGDAAVRKIIEAAHSLGVKVIVSSHDFSGTPGREEIVSKLRRMQKSGADIIKLAVMPKSPSDVDTLLEATAEMYTKYADRPLITVSMSKLGKKSRVCGHLFGSCVTFAAAAEETAPGQTSVSELKEAFAGQTIHS